MKEISLIFPLYKTDSKISKEIINSFNSQKLPFKVELVIVDKITDKETMDLIDNLPKRNKKFYLKKIKVDPSIGFSSSMNAGVLNSKNEIIVILQQDCIPLGENWLKDLVMPLNEDNVIASVSKVELPYDLWKKFDRISKILSAKEQKLITPLLDEKGCAYKKSALIKIGLFNDKLFKTAGEDFDAYIKLSKIGKISYPNIKLTHYHEYSSNKRLYKEIQLSNAFGTLVRIYGSIMPHSYFGFLRSIPLLGYPLFLHDIKIKKLSISEILFAIPLYLAVNFLYSYGFWKGFILGKQTV